MTIPIELVIAAITFIGGIGSVMVHLLIRIANTVSEIRLSHSVSDAQFKAEIDSAKRHLHRNEMETAQLQRHLKLAPQREQL